MERGAAPIEEVVRALEPLAKPLGGDRDLDPLLERIGDARYVLLGEATHGTHEFYDWRARITKRLVEEKGFSFVAVEGDWPDCERVNAYVKLAPDAPETAFEALHAFDRWPTWMWANREVLELVAWLRTRNGRLPPQARVGFYGLDVYSLWESMAEVVRYLEKVDPSSAARARGAYECFAPYGEEAENYAWGASLSPPGCQDEVARVLSELRASASGYAYADGGREAHFHAEQNALVAKNAEAYYRSMVSSGHASWNVRDGHMAETLERLMRFHGPAAKAIVWEHNTHIGDARYTDMIDEGEINVGQLVRERHGAEGVVLVGFSTYEGTVIAGDAWGAPMRVMTVPPGREKSHEDALHRVGRGDALFLFGGQASAPALLEPRGHRAVGVVYRPSFERYGNYVPTVLPRRYDALLYIERSRALEPLHAVERHEADLAETYPTGL
ncbi:MAG TPA: erythromycin esterase family protein [Polyangiaceae bacterium]|nr:erythromycin esterase family protein [Polyangiaceae bacterium]